MNALSKCLSSRDESLLGRVPALQDGREGHKQLAECFYRLCSLLKPSIFCDVGANQGDSGRIVLSRSEGSRVYGFEANPITYEKYRSINEAVGVRWINVAVCDQVGDIELRVPKTLARALVNGQLIDRVIHETEDTARSSLLFRDENATTQKVRVPAITLDAFFENESIETSDSAALWVDVEGAAAMVFEGSKSLLTRTKLVMVEVEGFPFWKGQKKVSDVIDLLNLFDLVPVLRDREYGDAQFNLIFLSASLTSDPNVSKVLMQSCKVSEARPSKNMALKDQLLPGKVPVLVPCFNNPTYCDSMYRQLIHLGFEDITFVDNKSTTEEMNAWLKEVAKEGVKVERLDRNLGPRKSIFSEGRLQRLRRWFCVTDPDLEFNDLLPKNFLEILGETLVRWDFAKVGFALDISRRDHMRPGKFKIGDNTYTITEWEDKFWRNRIGFTSGGDSVYEALVDTTFALYDLQKFNIEKFLYAVRVAGRFTAIHKPWMTKDYLSEKELTAYRKNQRHSYYS